MQEIIHVITQTQARHSGCGIIGLDAAEMKALDNPLAPGKISGKRYAAPLFTTIDR
jgi:hypothetical protein